MYSAEPTQQSSRLVFNTSRVMSVLERTHGTATLCCVVLELRSVQRSHPRSSVSRLSEMVRSYIAFNCMFSVNTPLVLFWLLSEEMIESLSSGGFRHPVRGCACCRVNLTERRGCYFTGVFGLEAGPSFSSHNTSRGEDGFSLFRRCGLETTNRIGLESASKKTHSLYNERER